MHALTPRVALQVDFSQSVHHLWKQYRRHGKAGGAEELAAANEQGEKEAKGPRGALPGGLKLKPGAGGLMGALQMSNRTLIGSSIGHGWLYMAIKYSR